jgi:hypothetical protein
MLAPKAITYNPSSGIMIFANLFLKISKAFDLLKL